MIASSAIYEPTRDYEPSYNIFAILFMHLQLLSRNVIICIIQNTTHTKRMRCRITFSVKNVKSRSSWKILIHKSKALVNK